MRESMAINEAGFWAVHRAYEPGRTQAELMAAAEELFARMGTGRQTMDMVAVGTRAARRRRSSASPTRSPRSTPATCCSTRSRWPGRAATGSSSRDR